MTERIPLETTDEIVRMAFEQCPFALIVVNGDGQIREVNQEVERLFGYTREDLLWQPVEMLVPEHLATPHAQLRGQYIAKPTARRVAAGRTTRARHRDGRDIPVRIDLSPMHTPEGMFIAVAVVDVSEFLHLEDRLRQTQKLEAIGNIAGGVAHDFNNIIHGVIAFTELAREEACGSPTIVGNLDRALDAARRGGNLANRILSFARNTDPARARTSLVAPVRAAAEFLRATLASNIEMRERFDPTTPLVMADGNEVYQVAMNLGTNAAHAMKWGGLLEFRVEPVRVDRDFSIQHPDARTGLHARLSVLDTGTGMPQEVIERAFEPFFTTKSAEEGTGLGLSIVHDIVRALGGCIDVHSLVGKGTRFDVYIPASSQDASWVGIKGSGRPRQHHILLVGEGGRSARLGKCVHESGDFHVTMHSSGTKALEDLRSHPDGFDLLITDCSSSGMSGPGLVEQVRAVRPDIPILVVSGESTSAEAPRGAGIRRLLSNPFHSADLKAAVQELIEGSR